MSNKITKWWAERSRPQKAAMIVVGGVATVVTGGAVAYAIAAYGGTLTITASATTVTASVGKAALELAKRS